VLPKVIIHNSVSLDGSLTDFEPNMGLHYQIAGNYPPDAHLIGSNTVFRRKKRRILRSRKELKACPIGLYLTLKVH
jgi:hypothetical protein